MLASKLTSVFSATRLVYWLQVPGEPVLVRARPRVRADLPHGGREVRRRWRGATPSRVRVCVLRANIQEVVQACVTVRMSMVVSEFRSITRSTLRRASTVDLPWLFCVSEQPLPLICLGCFV